MEQRTPAWYEWRSRGIGGSDAPIIMGVSKYMTVQELWEEKVYGKKRDQTFPQQVGIDMESEAMAHLQLLIDEDLYPETFEHQTHSFLRFSSDGWSFSKKILAEVKCCGQADHETALSGLVPKHYIPQVQHGAMICNPEKILYFSYYGNYSKTKRYEQRGKIIEVKPDLEYQKELLEKELWFWDCVVNKKKP